MTLGVDWVMQSDGRTAFKVLLVLAAAGRGGGHRDGHVDSAGIRGRTNPALAARLQRHRRRSRSAVPGGGEWRVSGLREALNQAVETPSVRSALMGP